MQTRAAGTGLPPPQSHAVGGADAAKRQAAAPLDMKRSAHYSSGRDKSALLRCRCRRRPPLGSLPATRSLGASAMDEQIIHSVPLKDIKVSDGNVRHHVSDRELAELADGIEAVGGLLQPVVLVGEYGNPPYELIIGQRRFLAHKRILAKRDHKWTSIRAVFVATLEPTQARVLSLAENMHRSELSHRDAADAVTYLYTEFGRNDRAVARATGMNLGTVRKYILVKERASEKALDLVEQRKVSLLDVKRALDAAQGNIGDADRILDRMVEMTGDEKRRLTHHASEHPEASVEELVSAASKPRMQTRLLVDLTEPVESGLRKAKSSMNMEPEEIAALALEEWLTDKGFIE